MIARSAHRAPRRGATLIEALVAMAVFLVGVATVLAYFPLTLRTMREAEHLREAVMLAQMKAEEMRRDDALSAGLIDAVENLPAGSETESKPFSFAPYLSYSFRSYSTHNETAYGPPIAHVLVRYSATYRPERDVVYELKFDSH